MRESETQIMTKEDCKTLSCMYTEERERDEQMSEREE